MYRMTYEELQKASAEEKVRVVQLESTHGLQASVPRLGATPKMMLMNKGNRGEEHQQKTCFSLYPNNVRLDTRGLLTWALPFG